MRMTMTMTMNNLCKSNEIRRGWVQERHSVQHRERSKEVQDTDPCYWYLSGDHEFLFPI